MDGNDIFPCIVLHDGMGLGLRPFKTNGLNIIDNKETLVNVIDQILNNELEHHKEFYTSLEEFSGEITIFKLTDTDEYVKSIIKEIEYKPVADEIALYKKLKAKYGDKY